MMPSKGDTSLPLYGSFFPESTTLSNFSQCYSTGSDSWIVVTIIMNHTRIPLLNA